MPLGPYILCAVIETRSTCAASTSNATLPTACTASVWNNTPRARHASRQAAIGCSTPISLLAAITVTSTVVGR